MFAPDIEDAIERFAREKGISREEALATLVRDWLLENGYMPALDDEAE